MCGIAGLITSPKVPKEKILFILKNFISELSSRGPDDSGIWIDDEVGIYLAHTRLSIVDLTTSGAQPMTSSSRRFTISFNGEIYNYQEIRKKINESKKISWKGNSDTEILLESIELFGLKKTLEMSRGMFAFALWDKFSKKLYLIRDRFGEKPIYWGVIRIKEIEEPMLIFGSELNAIYKIPGLKKSLNKEAIFEYFNFGYIPSPYSIQEGINQLRPGNYIEIPQQIVEDKFNRLPKSISWWDPYKESLSKSDLKKEPYMIDELERLLIESISLQSKSEVPICTFLSGGIDSTLIATLYQKINTNKINTFTISFPNEMKNNNNFNEGCYANKISNYLNTNHQEIALTSKDAINIIPNISNIYSEPFSDSSQIPTFLICKKAKLSGFKVALTGDGGDELFGGYNRHFILPKIHQYGKNFSDKSLNFASRFLDLLIKNECLLTNEKKQKLIMSIKYSNSLENSYFSLLKLWENTNNLLNEDFQFFNRDNRFELPEANTNAEKLMLSDLVNYLPNDILVKIDRASMANSLETRAPFLDHKIAKFAWKLPLEMKIPRSFMPKIGKLALLKILKKNLPEELYMRPKKGFSAPIGNWLRGPLKEWADDLLTPSLIQNQGYLNSNLVQDIWSQHINKRIDHSSKLWSILIWQSWLQNNFK